MNRRGMTMLEVMVTLAIAAVFASMSIAGMRTALDRKREDAAIASIGQAMNEARMRARQYRQPVRLAVTTVAGARSLRWERLACADAWGSSCPSTACATSACGVGGCECPEVGDAIALPTRLVTAAELDGLCFSAGSGAPKVKAAGTFCDGAAAAPGPGTLSFWTLGGVSHVLELEPLTGMGRLVDCRSGARDAAVCP